MSMFNAHKGRKSTRCQIGCQTSGWQRLSEQYEFSKDRPVSEGGSLNPSDYSLGHLNTEDRNGAIS